MPIFYLFTIICFLYNRVGATFAFCVLCWRLYRGAIETASSDPFVCNDSSQLSRFDEIVEAQLQGRHKSPMSQG